MSDVDYGKELIIDLHNCNASLFTRKSIRAYFKALCARIDMKRSKLTWWDDYRVAPEERQTEPHLKGTSAVQFITTSNITIHTLDLMQRVYINVFSCKDFDVEVVLAFTVKWFEGNVVHTKTVRRV